MKRLKAFLLSSLTLCPLVVAGADTPAAGKYEVAAPNLVVQLDENGCITGILLGGKKLSRPAAGGTEIAGCRIAGKVGHKSLSGGGVEFTRKLAGGGGNQACVLTDRFTPSKESVRWEIEIQGEGEPWTAPIQTRLEYPATSHAARFWAPWSDPRLGAVKPPKDEGGVANAVSPPGLEHNWADPLLPRQFTNATLWYGAPYFRYSEPRIGFCPFQGDLLCIPMASALEEIDDVGLSLVLSPEDRLLDLTLDVSEKGGLTFGRLFHRISGKKRLSFAMDLVAHEADWRGGLRWMSARYPEFFDPANPNADAMAGTGAYSNHDVEFDAAKMKKMAFSVNWRASFDFPYMGMFLPPVDGKVEWKRFGSGTTSIAGMQEYARGMKALGFHVLNYFNVTEFGARVRYPAPPRKAKKDSDLWKDCNDFIYYKMSRALLRVPDGMTSQSLKFYPKSTPGGVYYTWEDAVVMDCGEPVYKEFLLDQARRHIAEIPDADGICIDRMDWLRMYNEQRDDGVSWFEGRPARSLLNSWKDLLAELGPLMHRADKVVFVNNHDKRLDLLRHVDGIFDEFTYAGAPLNTTALLCIRKPALGWTADEGPIKQEGPDNFFQKYLYLGVYPMAPFPGNDHSIRPSEWVDRQYLDYGPLLACMRGKKWVLAPHPIEVKDGAAKANLFQVPGGFVVPVVFGGRKESVTVTLRNIGGLSSKATCQALHPGEEQWRVVAARMRETGLEMDVPLRRGCAMVKVAGLSPASRVAGK